MDINQVIQFLAIIFGSGGLASGGFAFYKWRKQRPLEEKMGQLETAKAALEMATDMLKVANVNSARQDKRINELSTKLKKTKIEFEEENNKLRQEFKKKQHEMELRFCCMFNLYEMQLLSLNATPILSKDNIMDANVDDLKRLVDTMREKASLVVVTEEEKKQGINKWSKMLDIFSGELEKDIEKIVIRG